VSLEQLASIASIIASGAVVISLIFIGLQLRQNAHLTRMAAAQTSAQLLSQNFGRVIEHADLAELLSRDLIANPWTAAEQLRASNFMSVSFRHYEVLHLHRRYGIFEEELWVGSEARLKEALATPAIRIWWEDCKSYYAGSFITYVDSLIAEIVAAEAISPLVGL